MDRNRIFLCRLIIPAVLFAIFAFLKKEYIALMIACGVFLIVFIGYLISQNSFGKGLYSALQKYEDQAKALQSDQKGKLQNLIVAGL